MGEFVLAGSGTTRAFASAATRDGKESHGRPFWYMRAGDAQEAPRAGERDEHATNAREEDNQTCGGATSRADMRRPAKWRSCGSSPTMRKIMQGGKE